MSIVCIALLVIACVLVVLLRLEAARLDKAYFLLDRRNSEIDALEKRVYELTGMLQQAQRIVNEIEMK